MISFDDAMDLTKIASGTFSVLIGATIYRLTKNKFGGWDMRRVKSARK
jgi:hypothetical protein